MALACAIIANAPALATYSYRIASADGSDTLSFGFYTSTSARWLLTTFLPKFAVALGIGQLLVRRARQQLVVADGS